MRRETSPVLILTMKSLAYGRRLESAKTVSLKALIPPTWNASIKSALRFTRSVSQLSSIRKTNSAATPTLTTCEGLCRFGPPCALSSARSINRASGGAPRFLTVHKLNPQLQFCEYTHRLQRPHCLPLLLNILIGSRPILNKYAQSRASYAVYLKRPPVDLVAIPLHALGPQVIKSNRKKRRGKKNRGREK